MVIVAENESTVIIDDGNFWKTYDPYAGAITDWINKKEYPNYLASLYAKWGYERINVEVESYNEIGEIDKQDRADYMKRRLLNQIQSELKTFRELRGDE